MLLSGAVALGAAAVPAAAARAAHDPKITVTPHTKLFDGQHVTVKASQFPPSARVHVYQCEGRTRALRAADPNCTPLYEHQATATTLGKAGNGRVTTTVHMNFCLTSCYIVAQRGSSAVQASAAISRPKSTTVASKIRHLRTRVTSSTITMRWSAPSSDGGTPITGYLITRSGLNTKGVWAPRHTVAADHRRATFRNLFHGKRYTVTVNAVNYWGNGPAVSATVRTLRR
jgi:hypothetical protein